MHSGHCKWPRFTTYASASFLPFAAMSEVSRILMPTTVHDTNARGSRAEPKKQNPGSKTRS